MVFKRLLFSILLLCFSTGISFSQNYPVQISMQVLPPFTGYLPDYVSPGNDNLRVFILFTDFSRPSYDIKLKFKLENQGILIQNHSWYYAGPFTVEPGIPLMLSGTDLNALLDENNLSFSGITRQQYDQRKVLPEGFYTLSLTAYDFQNPLPIVVSNEATTQAWMLLNDAPFANLPMCGTSVQVQTPQQLTFSWTCLSSSFSSGTEYTFELWEIFPANTNPGQIVSSTAPVYSVTTNLPLINYGITEPPLVVGREYVWKVHARDLDNRELFRNNGDSPLCTFTWGSINNLLGNLAAIQLTAQALTPRQARCTWDSISAFSSYQLQFRKANTNFSWFTLNTNRGSMRVTDLESNTDYEGEVRGVFPDGSFGPWSNIATWHTPQIQQLNCGQTSPPPAQQNFHPLTLASTGMIWQIGQFEMTVVTLQNTSSGGGWYSGTGKVFMPFGATLMCEFTGIQIGEDHTMYSGEVRAMTNGVTNWLVQYNMSQYQYDTSYYYNGTIDSMYVNANGELVIINSNGDTTVIQTSPGGTLITDENGNQWIVNNNGTIIPVTGGFLLPFTNDTLNAHELAILKMAMTIIRNDLSQNTIDNQQSDFLSSQDALINHVATQRQEFPSTGSPGGSISTDTTTFISYSEIPAPSSSSGSTISNTYKTEQLDYYSLRVLQILSRADCPDDELNLISQYLLVNGVIYKNFVIQQIALGKTDQQIATGVAQHSIQNLSVFLLKKQMSHQ
jgi:TANFOR domain-containing protein